MPSLGVVRGRGGGDFGFDDGITVLVLDRAAFARMNLPGGMTYSWCRKLGVEIQETAQGKLTVGHGYKTGELQRSVGWSRTPVGEGVVVNVRATSRHAIYYHEGSRPHRIEASFARALVFQGAYPRLIEKGKRAGQIKNPNNPNQLWFKPPNGVDHPGFGGDPFLREAMNEVLILNGITL